MANTREFACIKAKQTRYRDDGVKQGSSRDTHVLTGAAGSGSTELHYRSLMQFDHDFTGVRRIIKAELVLRTEDDSTHFEFGSRPRVSISRLLAAFSEETNGENEWSSGEYDAPRVTGNIEFALPLNSSTGKPQDNATLFIDITALFKMVTPTRISFADGAMGKGGTNWGFRVASPGSENNHEQRAIMLSRWTGTTTARPKIRITYDPSNRAPTAPTPLGPALTNVTMADVFEGQHNDPDLDPMSARDIWVWRKGVGTGEPAWKLPVSLQAAGSAEVATGRFSVPLSLATASLKPGIDYEWLAKTKDALGVWGPFSARRALKITSSAPAVVATNVGSVSQMADAIFGGTYLDPEANPLNEFHIQMQRTTGLDWNNADRNVWDTNEVLPTLDEVTNKTIARHYAGQAITADTYTYRIRAKDSTGVWSPWVEDAFVLTADYNVDPGDITLTTQIARDAPVRIALYSVFTNWPTNTTRAAGRGIGSLIGHVDDPIDLGASTYLNGGGEVYFTLPALHPYVPSIEPHQTHYHVEQWYGDRYRPIFAGIITDFDADTDEVVFFGTDYLGLLQTAVDERYDPKNAKKPPPAGSYYSNQTIDAIIKEQLTYHKGLANSPVGFIAVGTGSNFSALAERVTIYATYTEALPFITGLIDSHKQGTGREARFYAKPTSATYMGWVWALIDNWGKDRPNIRLEYGGLLNDFRVVALGDFGTRVLGVGQKRGEAAVYRKVGVGGLPETIWGRRSKTRFYEDITDVNDLQRRVNEDANVLSKVGKRIALAIRADVLAPFDGWDIGDNIIVDIDRGAVDSEGYGSGGYWTIYGVEWRYHPDGHTDLTFTVLPKKSATDPDPDLIPSVPGSVPLQWQAGYGVPVTYGEPPSPTPPPGGGALLRTSGDGVTALTELPLSEDTVQAAFYEDLNTGCIYELDQNLYDPPDSETPNPAYDTYFLVSCPPEGGGTTILDGHGPPADDLGSDGDFYIDLDTGTMYGPKDSGAVPIWPVAMSPAGADVTAPDIPTIKDLTSEPVTLDDGTSTTNILALVGYDPTPSGLTDLDTFVMQSTRYPREDDQSLPDWSLATQWETAVDDATGALDTVINQPAVHPVTIYWLRAAAVDVSGNRSGWSAVVDIETAGDLIAPPPPTGLVAQAGMSTIGVRWDPVPVNDLAYVEVQFRTAAYLPTLTADGGTDVLVDDATGTLYLEAD